MTRTISADSNNDIFIGTDGSLSTAEGIEAVLQACAQAAKAQLGEMLFAADQGLPNFSVVWSGSPNPRQYEAYLRQTLLAVPQVTGIQSIEISVSNNTLSYSAVINTTFGAGALNG